MDVRISSRMASPRGERFLWKLTLLILAALLPGRAGTHLHAQTVTNPPPTDTTARPATDTTARAATDTTRAATDTTTRPRDTTSVPATPAAPGERPDTTAGQNGMRPDTLAADTLRRDTTAGGSRPAGAEAPPPDPAPVDSALAVACRESGGEPPDLLTVVFRASATAAEREAAARQVGGTLVEQSRHQAPGAWYLHVPGSGMNPLVAERVILLPPVVEVGATRCPS
jgi:hypothetical protein